MRSGGDRLCLTVMPSFTASHAAKDSITVKHRRSSEAHLQAYSYRAYMKTSDAKQDINKRKKRNPRAWIGYLVGYDSTIHWRIWYPCLYRVV